MGNWKKTKIGEFLTQQKRQISIDSDIGYKLVTISNKGEVKLREIKSGATISAQKGYIANKGDFIYSRLSVHTGAFGIVPDVLDGALITNEMPCFEIDNSKILPDILIKMIGLPDFLWQLKQLTQGMGRVRIKENMMLSLSLCLPDIEEQQKIVTHFKSIETEDGELKDELTHQQTLLKKLRQQILQEAIEGKLTADWRAQNPDVEPASELLARIQAEKQQLIKDKKIKKQKPLPAISEEEKPFELPDGWVWCHVWDVAQQITSGSRDWAKYYADSGAIFVTMGNLSKESYQLRMDKVRYVRPPKNTEGARTKLAEGDLLISITGDVGNLGLIPKGFGEAYINQHTCMLRYMPKCQNSYFLELMRSPLAKRQYDAPQRGIKNSFRLGDVGEMLIPLPPLPEQKAIVAKVEKLLSVCDQLETQITHNQNHANALMQAVLKEAFTQTTEQTKPVAANG